jgi:subtilisin family serine protease
MTPQPDPGAFARAKTKTEYVIGRPTNFQMASEPYLSPFGDRSNDPAIEIIDALDENAEKLALMDDDGARRLTTLGLVVEPNILYQQAQPYYLEDFEPSTQNGGYVDIEVTSESKEPLEGVTIHLIDAIVQGRKSGCKGITDAHGICRLAIAERRARFPQLLLFPRRDYWSRVIESVEIQSTFSASLKPLPQTTPDVYDWGHVCARMTDGAGNFGEHVRIGIVDSGIRNDHNDLRPSGGVNCVYGEDDTNWYVDASGHGSHCAGIVAALGYRLKGYAPKCELFSYRVIRTGSTSATTFDLLKAIEHAVKDGCDIISMSLGSSTEQMLLQSKIEFAHSRGVLCLAATGNEGKSVHFPAAFPKAFGVGAFGEFGTYPQDSHHRSAESRTRSRDGRYFLAKFSNFGKRVQFCAPGVAIRSTVPGGYLAKDGTSMACPHIAGLAALALASRPDLFSAPRDAERVERLVQLLKASAEVFGFGSRFEGAGFPRIDRLLNQ